MLGPVELAAEVDSTNRVLLERARAGAPAGAVLVADHQTAGRGRLDRTWEAAPGAALLVSVLLRPDLPPDRLHLVTAAAGIAAVEAVEAVGAASVSLKWPNDVVVPDGRKLAGILAESVLETAGMPSVVVGMGLNLRSAPDGGVALDELTASAVPRDEVLSVWLDRYAAWLRRLDDVPPAYRLRCSTIGQAIRIEEPGGARRGHAVDVDDRGHLVVDLEEGRRTFAVADVVHVRAM